MSSASGVGSGLVDRVDALIAKQKNGKVRAGESGPRISVKAESPLEEVVLEDSVTIETTHTDPFYPDEARIVLIVRGDVMKRYSEESDRRGAPIAKLMEQRLARFAGASDTKPLYFTDHDRIELEGLLGRNFSSAADVIAAISWLVHLVVTDNDGQPLATIQLDPATLERLTRLAQYHDSSGHSLQDVIQRAAMLGLRQGGI